MSPQTVDCLFCLLSSAWLRHVTGLSTDSSLLLQITCGEFLSVYLSRIRHQSLGTKYLACVYKAVGSYVFGAAASQSLTDIAKYSIGRLRPNFLAVCKPAWDHINCKTGGYIENVNCTGDKFLVDEAR